MRPADTRSTIDPAGRATALDTPTAGKLLAMLERLYTPTQMQHFPDLVFEVVNTLIPECPMSFDDIDLRSGEHRAGFNFEPDDMAAFLATLAINLPRDHPAVRLRIDGTPIRFARLSEHISMRQLKQTGMYSDQFKTMGTRFQFGLFLDMPGHMIGISVNRDVDFSASEEALVKALTPHLSRAHANARLYTALRQAATGMPSFTPETLCALGLTPREAEVLQGIVEGKPNDEIAFDLQVSRRTVEKHCEHVFAKLGVESRAAAMVNAQEILQNRASNLEWADWQP